MSRALAAGIDATAQTVTASMNMAAQKDYNQKYLQGIQETNKTNLELAEKQNQWNIEQLADERAYNDPKRQVERLKGAGLSSAAAAQSIEGAGNSSHIESADLANQIAPEPLQAPQFDINAVASILGAMRSIAETRKADADADIAETDASLHEDFLLTDLDAKRADVAFKKFQLKKEVKSFPYTLRSLKFHSKADKLLPSYRKQEIENMKANRELVDMNVKRTRQDFNFLEKMNDKQIEKMCEEIKNVQVERETMKKQGELYSASASNQSAQAGLARQETEHAKEKTEGAKFENREKRVAAILAENGAPESTAQKVGVLLANGVIKPENLPSMLKGTKQYVKQGYNWLGDDVETRDFLYYIYDEGSSAASKLGSHTLGGIREIFSSVPHVNYNPDYAPPTK